MEVEHADPDLQRIEVEAPFMGGFGLPVVKQFRILMQIIRTASNRTVLYQFKGRRLEKLGGKRQHEHSMRLNKRFRLILQFAETETGEKVVIVAIENHYDR